jgi:vacuolar-type H+-ATPase subunit E/Vma4
VRRSGVTTNSDSVQVLLGEIMEEARRESEDIVNTARLEAEAMLEASSAEAQKIREEQMSRDRAEAARRRASIMSTVPVETVRLRAVRTESLLDAVRERVRKRLLGREGFDYRVALTLLASAAVRQMEGAVLVARVSESDRPFVGNGFCEEVLKSVGAPSTRMTLAFDADTTDGGVAVEDSEASQVCDNRFLKRLERMWPELRRQIAREASFVPRMEPGGTDQ